MNQPIPLNLTITPLHPVIDLMTEQREITDMGGTMRLGLYPCVLAKRN